MKRTIVRLAVNEEDGTLQLPVDSIVAALDRAAHELITSFTAPLRRPKPAQLKRVKDLAAGATNADEPLSSIDARVLGFALRETTGANPAVLELYTGTDATGDLLLPIALAPSESAREWYGDAGILSPRGLFMVRVSGQCKGAIFIDVEGSA